MSHNARHAAGALAACMAIAAIGWAGAALADNYYQPYYAQDTRAATQFTNIPAQYTNIAPPQLPGAQYAPQQPPPAPYTANIQAPPSAPQPVYASPSYQSSYQPPYQRAAYDADAAPQGPVMPLGTISGIEIGGEASYYHYNEPGNALSDRGPKIGATLGATQAFVNHMFGTVEGRFAYGRTDYQDNTGTSNNHEDDTWEVRALLGGDAYVTDRYALLPYLGIGYYDDDNDSHGATDGGGQSFRHSSEYLYIPFGVKPQMRVNGTDRLTADLEYDFFLQGQHTSHLGDFGNGDPTVRYQQGQGLGFRANVMYEHGNWEIGPFVEYWNVSNSSQKSYYSPNAACGSTTCTNAEPQSISVEGGLQLKYRFGIPR